MIKYTIDYINMHDELLRVIKENKDNINKQLAREKNGLLGHLLKCFEMYDEDSIDNSIETFYTIPIRIYRIDDNNNVIGSPALEDNIYYGEECMYELKEIDIRTLIKIADFFM